MSDSNQEQQLTQVRERIDSIDQQIQQLINERAQCVLDVGKIKRSAGDDAVFYRPEREAMVLRKVMERNQGPMDPDEVAKVFRTIMSACLAMQAPMQVAFLGPEGTFSQVATVKHFGLSVNLSPCQSISDVFKQVNNKEVHYGIVPIENSIGGIVNATMDAFIDVPLQICGEVKLTIHQNLLIKPEQQQVRRIYSHEQSLAQCKNWLHEHYPQVELIAVSSNAYAAQLASQEQDAAAIAGEQCAEQYGLQVKASNIEDKANNITRFLVIGYRQTPPCGDDRTSLLITLDNTPGSLERILTVLSKYHINMSLIKSRRSLEDENHYIFFIDVDTHRDEDKFQQAMDALQHESGLIKILGSYPKAVL